MFIRLELSEGTSHKFWEIRVEGAAHTVRFGKIGTDGQTQTKEHASNADARREAEKLVASKKKKGYVEASGAAPAGPQSARRKVGPHTVPELVDRFTTWFDGAKLPFRHLGIEGIGFEEIYEGWDPELTPTLRRDGFVWFTLGEGSMIAVLQVAGTTPVVLLDSEGGARMLAPSVEEFLHLWAAGETGTEIDEGTGLADLAAWLKKEGVKRPKKSPEFDFDRYLEGKDPASPNAGSSPDATVTTPKSAPIAGLSPELCALLDLVGRRVDDPVVTKFAAEVLGKKLPASTSFENDSAYVEGKAGLALGVGHDVNHDLYPPVVKTKRAFIPYVTALYILPSWKGMLPFGLTWDAQADDLTRAIGEPAMVRFCLGDDELRPDWTRNVDPVRGIDLKLARRKKGLSVLFRIRSAFALVSEHLIEQDKMPTGLFVAWAISRGLLDASRFPAHAKLIEDIRARRAQGSAFVAAALPRGLWNDHFIAKKGPGPFDLRDRLWHYFADKETLDQDLKALFGKKPGPHGHDAPALENDTWEAVDRATKTLDKRFSDYL